MRTTRYTIKLPDGDVVVAKAASNSAQEDATIEYFGAVDKLGKAETGTMQFFEWFVRERGRLLGASVEIATEGDYDGVAMETVAAHRKH
jgi:hypothetical protein